MNRRSFLALSALPLASIACAPAGRLPATGMIMTVRGPIRPEAMGATLAHEHLFSRFGLPPEEVPAYDEAAVVTAVLPRLAEVKALGVKTIVEATAAYFGRDPRLLRRLSEESGLHLITNTGYYGAANDRYVPEHVRTDSVDALAERWVVEWRDGIGGSGIRPGFMKLGVDAGPLSAVDEKLVRAGARAHLATGLTVAVHTGNSPESAAGQMAILEAEGVSPEAWVWVHAHAVGDVSALLSAARRGAWLSLDGYTAAGHDRFVERLSRLRQEGYLDRVLLSHDGNSFPGTAEGKPRPYVDVFRRLLPTLATQGFTAEEIEQLSRANPRRAFTVRVRRLGQR